MVKHRTSKAVGIFMASLAACSSGNVSVWLAYGKVTIMAVSTTSHNTSVVHQSASKAVGVFMAGIAT